MTPPSPTTPDEIIYTPAMEAIMKMKEDRQNLQKNLFLSPDRPVRSAKATAQYLIRSPEAKNSPKYSPLPSKIISPRSVGMFKVEIVIIRGFLNLKTFLSPFILSITTPGWPSAVSNYTSTTKVLISLSKNGFYPFFFHTSWVSENFFIMSAKNRNANF